MTITRLILFLFLFTSFFGSSKALANTNCSWPTVRHDSRLTARADCVGPQTNNIRWIYDFNLENNVYVRTLVIGHDGTIYCYRNPSTTAKAKLYAISPSGTLQVEHLNGAIQSMIPLEFIKSL